MPDLRICFAKPGFFLTDTRLRVFLDGHPVYDGSFMSGMDVTVPAAPGAHRLETQIELAPIVRKKQWDLTVGEAGATATLEYSRFWGNFKKRLRVG